MEYNRPVGQAQARAFARDIYQTRKLQHVVVLADDDRDGHLGTEELAKAARGMQAPTPARLMVRLLEVPDGTTWNELQSAQAFVIWTDAEMAKLLSARLAELRPAVPVYLCRKAAEQDAIDGVELPAEGGAGGNERWIAVAPGTREAWAGFARSYQRHYGVAPGRGAAEVYDAVRLLGASLRQSGPNRARLRDALSGVTAFAGASGAISFDHAGDNTSPLELLKLP